MMEPDNREGLGHFLRPMGLLTDLYQLTMAYGYWKLGMANKESVFHSIFRTSPFKGGFAVAAGLSTLIDFISQFRFDASDAAYLGTLTGSDGNPLFEKQFLDYLMEMEFNCHMDAVPEGTVMFPYEPLVRVRGPIIQCQILETALLNIMNFQTLIATKAARIRMAAEGDPVLEFGLRRAQGVDGGLMASRAAYIGGCDATSNALAGKMFDIPVKGTMAHSWIMAFADELESFKAYVSSLPNNSVLLVDTYSTLEGVKKAVTAAKLLRENGHRFLGIRLDSGDLADLSIEARKILDNSGFPDAKIVASSDLDEASIRDLKSRGARIDIWGVGTRLATAYDQPALDGVYKLSALRTPGDPWEYKLKLSERQAKISIPGILQVRRYRSGEGYLADGIYDEEGGIGEATTLIHPLEGTVRHHIDAGTPHEDLLVPVFRHGRRVYDPPSVERSRQRVNNEIARLHPGITRFEEPESYPVGLERNLFDLKAELTRKVMEIGKETD